MNAAAMFTRYDIENPAGTEMVEIGPLSYVAAALFSGLYVVFKAGTIRLLSVVLWTVMFAVLWTVVLSLAVLVSGPAQVLVIIIAAPTILLLQSLKMLQLVRSSYRRRGWLIRAR